MKVSYGGRDRYTLRGALRYPDGHVPPLGTIVGPNGYGEYVTVVAHGDGGRALVAVATKDDFDAMADRGEPGSLAERRLRAARGGG